MRARQSCAMRSPVPRHSTRHKPFLTALFALVVGLFALGPLTDAVACAPEAPHIAAKAAVDTDQITGFSADADNHPDGAAHGCAHGHCHAPAGLPPSDLIQTSAWTTTARLGAPPQAALISSAPDGLIRPPRA